MSEIGSANSLPTASPPTSPATVAVAASATSSFSPNKRMQEGECFNCKKQGHWARDCPSKSPKKSPPSTEGGSTRDVNYPRIQCPCGSGACIIFVSKTERNYNRNFYNCPQRGNRKCGFFKWCDKVTEKDINLSPNVDYPKCPCGAGVCSRGTEAREPNVGRSYFVCPIKKGHGACNFFQWEDTIENNKVNEHLDKSKGYGSPQSTCDSDRVFDSVNYDLQGNDNLSVEETSRNGFSAQKVGSVRDFSNLVVSPSFLAIDALLTENQESGGTLNILTVEQDGPPLCMNPQNESSILYFTKGDPIILEKSQSEHCGQKEFWWQITAAGDILSADFIHQNLGLQVLGWLGRLAFPPSRCLKDHPPSPFFCGIFPAFDPIFVPQDRDMLDPEVLTPVPHHLSISDLEELPTPNPCDLQLQNCGIQKPSGLKRSSSTMEDDHISDLISESFEQTALCLQNHLVKILNSIDPSKHDLMTSTAVKFFSVLDGMPIDYRTFAQRVKEFINHAAQVSCIEQSFCRSQSLQELVEQYDGEKARFDDVSKAHEKAVVAFTNSSQYLQSFREEGTRVRERLRQIENQLSCCEAETSQLKTNMDVIAGDKLEALRKMEKAEESLKLCKQREEELSTAKAALEKICCSMQEVCGLRLAKRQRL